MTRILFLILFCGLCSDQVWAKQTSFDTDSTKYEVLVVTSNIGKGFAKFDAVIESDGADPLVQTFEAPYRLGVFAEEFSAKINRLTGAGEIRVIVREKGNNSGENYAEYTIVEERIEICAVAQDNRITITQCDS